MKPMRDRTRRYRTAARWLRLATWLVLIASATIAMIRGGTVDARWATIDGIVLAAMVTVLWSQRRW